MLFFVQAGKIFLSRSAYNRVTLFQVDHGRVRGSSPAGRLSRVSSPPASAFGQPRSAAQKPVGSDPSLRRSVPQLSRNGSTSTEPRMFRGHRALAPPPDSQHRHLSVAAVPASITRRTTFRLVIVAVVVVVVIIIIIQHASRIAPGIRRPRLHRRRNRLTDQVKSFLSSRPSLLVSASHHILAMNVANFSSNHSSVSFLFAIYRELQKFVLIMRFFLHFLIHVHYIFFMIHAVQQNIVLFLFLRECPIPLSLSVVPPHPTPPHASKKDVLHSLHRPSWAQS